MAITHSGLAALGVPEDSCRASRRRCRWAWPPTHALRDYGANDPKHWEPEVGSGAIHTGVSVFSDSEETWRSTMDMARPHYQNALSPRHDETHRGLYFIFLSAKAMATMEFLQQEWINNGSFMGLGDERDPNVELQEDGATFTIPQAPVRRRIHGIETSNVLRGGEYFFLPSLSALRWLGEER